MVTRKTTRAEKISKPGVYAVPLTADEIQEGGSHYKDMGVQPWTVMEALLTREEFIGYLKGNLIKYGMRQGKKDSPDAEKWFHYNMKLKEVQHEQNICWHLPQIQRGFIKRRLVGPN